MATISLCMIVKNEEAVLERCLSSVADLMDEIVIVDTGSTDRTKEIAAKYTDKLYDFPWTDDFSAARNFSFSKAAMEYIYAADADEVLDAKNHERFAVLKQIIAPEIEIVQMKYITDNAYNTVLNIHGEYRPKLYRRLRQFRWIDPVHETVQTEPLVFDSDIEIRHMPQSRHGRRDFHIFLSNFKNGQPFSDKLHSMYARELYIAGTEEDFLQAQPVFYQTVLQETEPTQRLLEALCILCRCMRIQDRISDFFKYALRVSTSQPCAEACCELGAYFSQKGDYEEAVRWYYSAAYEVSAILDIHAGGDLPLTELVRCCRAVAESGADNSETYSRLAKEYASAAADWQMPVEETH